MPCAVGWIAYSYLTKDLFVLFANVPGLLVSMWLNFGAIKLQYRTTYMHCEQQTRLLRRHHRRLVGNDASNDGRIFPSQPTANGGHDQNSYEHGVEAIETVSSTVPHERKVLWVLLFWVAVCSAVAHIQSLTNYQREQIVGYVVNINLCFFTLHP